MEPLSFVGPSQAELMGIQPELDRIQVEKG